MNAVVSVSVLLPFYNPGEHFRDAIKSVLTQDFFDFELLLINNNSDKDSIELSRYEAENDSRVRILDVPEQGIAHALNFGLDHCKGEFIARMDADDICLQGRLRIQNDFLIQNPDIGLVGGLVRPISMEGHSDGMMNFISQSNNWISSEDIYKHRFIETPFIHPTVMFRKALIEKFGKYGVDNLPEDYELWLRWLSEGVKMSKVPVEVLAWRDHPSRLTRQHPDYNRESFRK